MLLALSLPRKFNQDLGDIFTALKYSLFVLPFVVYITEMQCGFRRYSPIIYFSNAKIIKRMILNRVSQPA